MTCWDCGVRTGTTDAVDDHRAQTIHRICVRCMNRWRPFLTRYTGTAMHYDTDAGRVTETAVVK